MQPGICSQKHYRNIWVKSFSFYLERFRRYGVLKNERYFFGPPCIFGGVLSTSIVFCRFAADDCRHGRRPHTTGRQRLQLFLGRGPTGRQLWRRRRQRRGSVGGPERGVVDGGHPASPPPAARGAAVCRRACRPFAAGAHAHSLGRARRRCRNLLPRTRPVVRIDRTRCRRPVYSVRRKSGTTDS